MNAERYFSGKKGNYTLFHPIYHALQLSDTVTLHDTVIACGADGICRVARLWQALCI